MCEVRFNMTDDELRTRVTTYLANIHQLRNQLRNQHRSQFIDKAWFPRIRNDAFNQWNDILSNNVALLRTCASVYDLMEELWEIKDRSGVSGIGEVTVHRTAEILANLWDLDMNVSCWSMAYSQMTSFCVRNNITNEALIERVAAEYDRLAEMTLMDKIIFVNSLLLTDSLEVVR